MREDPILSGGLLKLLLVLLVAGGLGAGAYALAGGGLGIDLPDFPDIETLGEETTTNLEDTALSDTTIGGATETPGDGAEPADPFTTAGFSEAIAKVTDAVGPGQELTRLFVNPTQTQLILRRGEEVEAYSVRADSGELVREDATITISGNAKISDFAFALDEVKPAAIDRMLASANDQSGVADFEPTVLSLERAIPFGSRQLQWTINAQGRGRNLLYRASADGRKVRNEGGEGTEIPPAALEAQKLNECIQSAGQDPEQIFACLERFR